MAADYAMTQELLVSHQVLKPVSEIHGVICGQLCADDTAYDLDLSLKILEIKGDNSEVITSLLNMLAEDCEGQLGADDFAFQPLLPDDDQDLAVRLAALAQWCDGFNAGFAGAWSREDADMTEQIREVLGDFSRIALVEQGDEQEDEASDRENEFNLMEVVEYVRMAAITLFLQNGGKPVAADNRDDEQPDVELH